MRMGALLTLETAKIESSEWKTNGFQMFLYPLRFSKCEEVQGQELHKTPPELIIFGLRADLAFCTDGIFCIKTTLSCTCWNFCFHSFLWLVFLVRFPEFH